MKVAVFGTQSFDKQYLKEANEQAGGAHELKFYKPNLTRDTLPLADGYDAVCIFVNDVADREVVEGLAERGVRLIALRAAGFNNVDLEAARERGIGVVRVPAYSPYAVAEHTVALLLALNRKIYRAFNRVRDGNFLLDGLTGFDVRGKTVGIVGTGKIGLAVASIFKGFGTRILAHDKYPSEEAKALGVEYVELERLFEESNVVTLHCPLTPETYHLADADAFERMKEGAIFLNTSRGALVESSAMVDALKSGKLGGVGLDVYEEEADLFFKDLSDRVIQDDLFARLLTFPNVVVTGHQGFLTVEALRNIAETTIGNVTDYERKGKSENEVEPQRASA
jgi:D-lactate dehydrogenase